MRHPSTWTKPLTHRVWFRVVLVLCFVAPAVTELPYDPAETPAVVQAVLADPYVTAAPEFLPAAKLILVAVSVPAVLGGRGTGRILLGYYAAVLVVVGFLQNMADTATHGFAWLLGNTLVQLVVAVWCLIDAAAEHTTMTAGHLRLKRLWLLFPMLLALLMPYEIRADRVVPSLGTVWDNEAGVTYCMITPVILGVLLLKPDGVDRRTLSIISFVGWVFGVINLVVWFGLTPQDWWMGVLHLPLVILASYGLYDSRYSVIRAQGTSGGDAPGTWVQATR